MMGIYCIHNKKDGKIYIGSSIDLDKRIKAHLNKLNRNVGTIHLQRAWNKDGKDNFEFFILEFVKDKEDLIKVEQKWLDQTQSYNSENGYNFCPTAGSNLGITWTDEHKNKIRKTLMGKYVGDKSPTWGRKASKESREKMSKSHKGKKHTEKSKLKISNTLKGKMAGDKNPMYGKTGENHHFYGKHHTAETINKIRKSTSGVNNHNYGKHFSEDHKRKISISQAGEKGYHAKLKEDEARFILSNKLIKNNKYSITELSSFFNISKGSIQDIIYRRTWKYITLMTLDEFEIFEKKICKKGRC